MTDKLSEFLQKIDYLNNHDPRKLVENKVKLDKKIKDAVIKINKSKWVWTLWCCQGHNRGINKGSVPYYVFIVEKTKLGDLLSKIHNSSPKQATEEFPCHNGAFWYEISPGFEDENFMVLSLHYCRAYGNLSLNRIQQSMNDLADLICEVNNG